MTGLGRGLAEKKDMLRKILTRNLARMYTTEIDPGYGQDSFCTSGL